ncbi:GNAT family N-acetyltransferase [Paenibacillus turicensis]|uniref:GNAT family N-acetyltransferase n=1 Tax=Paenibacillus turicensis TaxID=160487 RepID=UPI001AEA8E27
MGFFTSTAFRKQGYAGAMVAELCSLLKLESLEPMLYTDLANTNSLRVFKNIGFAEMGKVMDIKFTKTSCTH